MLTLLLALTQSPRDTVRPEVWAPHRVWNTHQKKFADFEALADAASHADVVFLGEQHDDAATHRMELALLEAVARRRSNVVLALEMFERDVQPILDQYLAGSISEESFLKSARPWPNYPSDYRPLVEFARVHHWKVVAGDIPRPMASAVARNGLASVMARTDSTRAWMASEIDCPIGDDYYKRFVVAMGDHPAAGMPSNENMYRAQCVKDETMAESIVRAERDATAPLVIQYNGDFHSDFGEGTAARVRRRLPKAHVMVISAVPVDRLDQLDPKALGKEGDWLLFVLKQQP